MHSETTNKKPKILFIASGLVKQFGGPPQVITGVVRELKRLGFDLQLFIFGQSEKSIVFNSDFYNQLSADSVNYFNMGNNRNSRYGSLPKLKNLRKIVTTLHGSDIVFLDQIYNLQNIALSILAKISATKIVIMPHGTLTTYQRNQGQIKKWILSPIFNFMISQCDALFVATEIERSQLQIKYRAKAQVVGIGVDFDGYFVESQILNEPVRILFISRITKKKNLELTIEVLNLVSKKLKLQILFVVCGSSTDPKFPTSYDYSKHNHEYFKIEFKGWLDESDKKKEILNCHYSILLSEDENFAISIAESLAYGRPCIVTKGVALSGIVEYFSAGIIVDSLKVDQIVDKLLQNLTKKYHQQSKNCFKASEELQWKNVSKKWAEAFRQISPQENIRNSVKSTQLE